MNLSPLESRVRAIRRKMAQARAQRVIHPMVQEHCIQWARGQGRPQAHP